MMRTLLVALAAPAIVASTVIPVALYDGQWNVVITFAIAALLLGAVALAAHRTLPGAVDPSTPTLLALVAAMWIELAVVFGLITWVAVHTATDAGGASELLDSTSALFEAISGVSTTGLSMLGDSSQADPWLQWWRSAMQWFGAIGMVLFAATVAEPSGDADTLVDSEWGEKPGVNAGQTVRRLGLILVSLTLASVAAMIVAGDPVWRAVNHGMAAAATGGFSITRDSAAASGPATQVILALTLFVSAISFGTIWDRSQRVGVAFWRRTQIRWGVTISAIGIIAGIVVAGGDAPIGSLVFNSISASTTGGFSLGDSFATISALGVITTVSLLIGGAAGSTAGGIKVARVAWIGKAILRWLPGDSDVSDETPYVWDGESVEVDDARHRILGAAAIIATWITILAVGTVVLAVFNPDTATADLLFDSVSAGSGAGMSRGVTDADSNGITKGVLATLMLAGRVEMTAFVVLLFKPVIFVRGTVQSSSESTESASGS